MKRAKQPRRFRVSRIAMCEDPRLRQYPRRPAQYDWSIIVRGRA